MGDTPFQTFIELISLDQQINKFNKDLGLLNKQTDQLVKERSDFETQLNTIKIRVHDAQKVVDAHELEMKDLDAQEQAKKKQLENLSSHRDYASLKSEIDFLKKKQHELEDTLISAWNNLENAKKEFGSKEEELNTKSKSFDDQLVKIADQKTKVSQEIEALTAQRMPLQEKVPADWIEKYNTMRTRVADPVVPVINGVCSACDYPVSEQDLISISHRKMLQCKDCFRLLYLPQAQEKAGQA